MGNSIGGFAHYPPSSAPSTLLRHTTPPQEDHVTMRVVDCRRDFSLGEGQAASRTGICPLHATASPSWEIFTPHTTHCMPCITKPTGTRKAMPSIENGGRQERPEEEVEVDVEVENAALPLPSLLSSLSSASSPLSPTFSPITPDLYFTNWQIPSPFDIWQFHGCVRNSIG